MLAICVRDCFDSKKAMLYKRNDQYDVDPSDPVAVHFELPVIEKRRPLQDEAKNRTPVPDPDAMPDEGKKKE